MKFLRHLPILFASVLIGCATSTQTPRAQYEPLLGKEIYAFVLSKVDVPEQDILKSEACIKRDALCMSMLYAARQMEFATVAVHTNIVIRKAFVPRAEDVKYGDIIKLRIPPDVTKAPVFIEFGARIHESLFKKCNWVNGSPHLGTGGIVCNGWSYKDVAKL